MLKKRVRHLQWSAAAASGRRPLPPPADDRIDVDPALECSRVTSLFGRPYPVQFRHQGAIDAWTRALGSTDDWRRWQAPGTLAWHIRQEICWQLEQMDPVSLAPKEEAEKVTTNRRMLAVEISANLKFHLNKGAVIEATDAQARIIPCARYRSAPGRRLILFERDDAADLAARHSRRREIVQRQHLAQAFRTFRRERMVVERQVGDETPMHARPVRQPDRRAQAA